MQYPIFCLKASKRAKKQKRGVIWDLEAKSALKIFRIKK